MYIEIGGGGGYDMILGKRRDEGRCEWMGGGHDIGGGVEGGACMKRFPQIYQDLYRK